MRLKSGENMIYIIIFITNKPTTNKQKKAGLKPALHLYQSFLISLLK
jgi:hypothetical protein